MIRIFAMLVAFSAWASLGHAEDPRTTSVDTGSVQILAPTSGSEKGPLVLLPLSLAETHCLFSIDGANDVSATQAKEPNHATLVHHHRSKGLGSAVVTEVAKIWLADKSLYLQWTNAEKAAEAAAQLKYAILRVKGPGGEDLAVCQFVEPQAAAIKLQGKESIKLIAPADILDKLKLEILKVPDGWEQQPAEDGKSLTLKKGPVSISFTLDEGGASLKSRTVGVGAVPEDPKRRLVGIDRELSLAHDDLKHRQDAYTRARHLYSDSSKSSKAKDERSSIQAGIRVVQEKIDTLSTLRAKVAVEAAAAGDAPAQPGGDLPREAILRAVLGNGVCVASVSLNGKSE